MNMKKIIQNGIILIGFTLLAAAGYYLYLQQGDLLLELADDDLTAQLERESQAFIAKQNELRSIDLELELFDDERFMDLRSFATPVPDLEVGKENPFAEVDFEVLELERTTGSGASGSITTTPDS